MNASVALVGFATFILALLVISRMLHWLTLVRSITSTSAEGQYKGSLLLLPLVLHSGLWTLVLAAIATYYAVGFFDTPQMVAAYAGFGFAAALILAASLLSLVRQRQPKSELPLMPERLVAIRRRFFWGNSLFFAALASAGSFFLSGFTARDALGFAVLVFPVGFLGGWVWCWFMWQWYGAILQVREKRRKQRENGHAV